MKKFFYKLFVILVVCFFQIQVVFSQGLLNPDVKNGIHNNTNKIDSFDQSQTVWSVVGLFIKAFLSLMAIIFLTLVVFAGYNWMTAGGSEDKVKKAKDTIQRAIIGLIIIAASYIITGFVLKNLPGA